MAKPAFTGILFVENHLNEVASSGERAFCWLQNAIGSA
jgi:hypothetical protein